MSRKQRALAYEFDKHVLGEQAHYIHTYWWNRIVMLRSYVHGWQIGPSVNRHGIRTPFWG